MDADGKNSEIEPINPILDMIEYLESIKIDKLTIGGGEPLLRGDLVEILKKATKSMPTSILTNGTLINQKIMEKLRQSGIQGISISLDSPHPEIHNHYRDGSFDLANEALKFCTKEGMDVDMSVCLTKKNFRDALNLIEMAENMGLTSITFEGLNPVGRGKNLLPLRLTAHETDFVLNNINDYLKDEKPDVDVILFYPQWVRWDSSASGCEACKDLFSLLPNGDMLACSNLPVILGNILEEDFKDIWNSKLANYIRNKRFGGCNTCEFKEKCGGCRSRAYGTGNIFGSDPSCTLAYKNR